MEPGRNPVSIRLGGCRDLLLRRAVQADLDSIWNIEKEAHLLPWSRSSIEYELLQESSSVFWAACTRTSLKEIRAYVCFRIFYHELYVLNLAVDKKARRKGLGTWIMFMCLRFGMQSGVTRAVLDLHRENKEAERFYRKMGFRFADPLGKNQKIFSVMEMHFAESCLDFLH